MAQTVAKYLGCFGEKICQTENFKSTQCRRTGYEKWKDGKVAYKDEGVQEDGNGRDTENL